MSLTTYTLACRVCLKLFEKQLDTDRVRRWQRGELIQNVFPELSKEDRELMISGTCAECFDKVFR